MNNFDYKFVKHLFDSGVLVFPAHSVKKHPLVRWRGRTDYTYQDFVSDHQDIQARAFSPIGAYATGIDVLDIDVKNAPSSFDVEYFLQVLFDVWQGFIVESSPSGGVHLLFMSDQQREGSEWLLAQNVDRKPFIEYRGKYSNFGTKIYPSQGYALVHSEGLNTIAPEVLDEVLEVCRSFNLLPIESEPSPIPTFEAQPVQGGQYFSVVERYNHVFPLLMNLKRFGFRIRGKDVFYHDDTNRAGYINRAGKLRIFSHTVSSALGGATMADSATLSVFFEFGGNWKNFNRFYFQQFK